MSARIAVEIAAIVLMLGAALLSAIGLFRSRDALAAIHCASLASMVVPVMLLIAVAAAKLDAEATVKTVILAAVVVTTGPIASHALARAIYVRSLK